MTDRPLDPAAPAGASTPGGPDGPRGSEAPPGEGVDPFRRMIDAIPDALIRFDREGRILFCNARFSDLYGVDPHAVVGVRIGDFADPDRAMLVLSVIEEVFATGEEQSPIELLTGLEMDVAVEARCVPELAADGTVESMLAILRDVSSLRSVEQELRDTERRFEAMVRYSTDIITVIDPDGSWRYSSPEGTRLLGYPEGYDPAGGIFSLLHPDDVPRALEILDRVLHGDHLGAEPFELRIFDVGGREHIIESVVQNLVDEPSVRGIVINSRDITERRRAEEELRFGEESLRVLADAVPVGIFDVSLDGTRQFANRYLVELRGGEEVDPATAWRELVHPEDHDLVRDAFIAAIEQRTMITVRHRVVGGTMPDEAWVELRLAPLLDGEGNVVRVLGSVSDISAAVETERSLAAARDAALEASRVKSQFLANVSHEIRTPLNAILGMAALLLDSDLSSEQMDRLVTLRSAGTQLLELLEDVLDLSRIEANQLELDRTPVDLRQVVSEAVGVFLAAAHEKGIHLQLDGADVDLPLVLGDPLRLRQVLVNLVGNAVKFTEAGGVTVRVAVEPPAAAESGAEGTVVRFEVADTGIGIAPALRDGLFEPFRQGDVSTTRRHGGTGLGLAITRQLVDLMGGTIELNSRLGVGSTFIVRLPFAPTAVEPGLAQPVLPGRQLAPGTSRAAGRHVLVVEDNDVNQQVVTAFLRRLGCTFDAVTDGADAVTACASAPVPYDVVLMDCQMPGMDGFEATRAIRRDEAATGRPRARVVAVTAGAMESERERCFEAGMDGYLAKPFSLVALEQVVLDTGSRFEQSYATVPGGASRAGPSAVAEPASVPAADIDADARPSAGSGTGGRALTGLRELPDALLLEAAGLLRALVPGHLDALRAAIGAVAVSSARDALASIRDAAEAVGAAPLIDAVGVCERLLQDDAPPAELQDATVAVEAAWRQVERSLPA